MMDLSKEELEKELEAIDALLREEGAPIRSRQIRGVQEFAKRHKLSMPVTAPIPGTHHESYEYWPLAKSILDWFGDRYGRKLTIDMSPGMAAFLLRGDVWCFRFPFLSGRHILYTDLRKTKRARGLETSGRLNVLDSIIDLPDGLRNSLTDTECDELLRLFVDASRSLSILEQASTSRAKRNRLLTSARADMEASVNHLLASTPNYGLSKWSSCQVAEKCLKAVIAKREGTFSKTHNLEKLAEQLTTTGGAADLSAIRSLSCTAGIRYGEEHTTLEEAVAAHHAALTLLRALENELLG